MFSKLMMFVSLFSLSAAGMVMSAAAPNRIAAGGSCCAGCPLCGESCPCFCEDGCECCLGGVCVCENCGCPCCVAGASAQTADQCSVSLAKSVCAKSGKCCAAKQQQIDLTLSTEATDLQLADATLPANLSGGCCAGCPLCGEFCTCDCPADCSCCTDGICVCDVCSCPCCVVK